MTIKAPEIHLRIGLDGRVREVDVVADTPEGRDRALARLHQFLPTIELLESLVAEPPQKEVQSDRAGTAGNTAAVG